MCNITFYITIFTQKLKTFHERHRFKGDILEFMERKKKKVNKINENFLTSNIFRFDSYSCNCKINITSPFPCGDKVEILSVISNKEKEIHFAFGSKIGLVRLSEDGSIAESNILGKLLAIDKNKLSNYKSFLERNGFFLPISQIEFEEIKSIEFNSIINRLQATLELMSTITDMSRTSYEKIVRLLTYLLFAPIVTIETKNGKNTYTSTKHPYTLFLEKSNDLPKEERLLDTFNNYEFEFTDNIYAKTILDADFVTKVPTGNYDEKYNTELFKKISSVYFSNRSNIAKKYLYINDFLFQYFYKVGVIQNVDLETTTYVKNEIHKDSFDEKLKKAAIRVAKLLIKEEIESNLMNVRVSYDIAKMEPSWKIDSLLSALYFGLFYMNPKMETYRRCANPKCNEFFLVNVSSQKKKYCCKECMNRDIQRRHRTKLKKLESKAK